MKVLIYGRVSTQNQDVERQTNELKTYCKNNKWKIDRIFTETISGTKTRRERKKMNQLLEYVDKNKDIKGVLVWELSRLGRNTKDVLDIIDELTKRKIWLFSKKENIFTLETDGTKNPTTTLTLTILSGVSTLERETTVERSISGLKNSVSDGNWVGGKFLPYGYKRVNKKLVIDEEESEVIKLIFNLYLEGNGTKKISTELNKRKIPTRYNKIVERVKINDIERKGEDFTWKDGTVYSILTNPVYIGKKQGKGNLSGLTLKSPVIIEEEIFNNVQFRLKNTTKKYTTRFFYLFDKKLKCGVCGRNYHPHKRKTNKDNRYVCLSKRYGESCTNFGISIPKMNNGVWSLLRHDELELKNILKNNSNKEELEREIEILTNSITSLRQDKKKIDNKEKKLLELFLDDKIDRSLYDRNYKSIERDKEKIVNELSESLNLLEIKKEYKTKQDDVNNQLRGIKDDKRLLKRTINNVVDRIEIFPVFENNISDYIKVNKQDKFVYVEVYTYLNKNFPLSFIISQRSENIIFSKESEFDKDSFQYKVGGNDHQYEEEGNIFNYRRLYHLKSLDN